MKLSITRTQRSLLLFLSASGFVAWFAGVGAPLDAANITGPRIASITMPPSAPIPRVAEAIVRDPFAGAPVEPAALERPAPSGDTVPAIPASPSDAAGGTTDSVPNIGNAMPPAAAAPTPAVSLIVRATIVGKTSVAYVANGSEMDIVRVGDSLGDRRVTTIDLEGIAFDDGTRLDLSSTYLATSAPVASTHGDIAIPLEALRKMLQPLRTRPAQTPATTGVPLATARPEQSPAVVAEPPEALPTADQHGLSPGQNPTPDAGGATAFPYPYPYPPTHR